MALDCWAGDTKNYTEEQMESARFDDGVKRIFPRMKEFEKTCDLAKIRFPIDHLIAKRTELSQEAVTYAFGPEFVAKHHIAASSGQQQSPSK